MFPNIIILILSIETIAEGKTRDPRDPPTSDEFRRDRIQEKIVGKVKEFFRPPEGCIRPRPGLPPGPPRGPKGDQRMRWLPCSLNFCVVR